jgi:hypothetical protein
MSLWVKSAAPFNRWLPVNFRYAPLATESAALQDVAKGHKPTSLDAVHR